MFFSNYLWPTDVLRNIVNDIIFTINLLINILHYNFIPIILLTMNITMDFTLIYCFQKI